MTVSFSISLHAENVKLIVGRGNGHYPPFEIMNSDGTLEGFHIELVRAVAARLNMEVEFQSLPWKRALYFLRQGRLDAVTYMRKTEEREKYAIYLDGNRISYSVNSFLVHKDNMNSIAYSGDFEQLKHLRIGVVLGYSYGDKFDKASWPYLDTSSDNELVLIKKLVSKRVDIILGNTYRIEYMVRNHAECDCVYALKPELTAIPQYIAFSKRKDHWNLARQFEKEMIKYKKTKHYKDLVERYSVKDIDRKE